jgi:hypothetical protein
MASIIALLNSKIGSSRVLCFGILFKSTSKPMQRNDFFGEFD